MTIIYTCPKCEQILNGTIGNLTCPDCGYCSKKYEPINLPIVDHSGWTIPQQVRKIGEEYGEVAEAVAMSDPVSTIREALDTMQTCATLINMVQSEYNLNLARLLLEHEEKLINKGYMGTPRHSRHWTCMFCGFLNMSKHEVCERCGGERK